MTDANEPINVTTFRDGEVNNTGLTKREYFAAMAMQGLWQSTTDANYENYERIAEMAVKQADTLINALNHPLK